MDIGASQITNVIVASTTSYLGTYSSVFLLIGGLVLALGVIGGLIDVFFYRGTETYIPENMTNFSGGGRYNRYRQISDSARIYLDPSEEQISLRNKFNSITNSSERLSFFRKNKDKFYDFSNPKSERNAMRKEKSLSKEEYEVYQSQFNNSDKK